MRIPNEFGKDALGEPRVWWHWQNLRNDRPQKKWPHGRAWLHFGYRQTFGLEWVVLPSKWRLGLKFKFTDRGDENLSGSVHLLLLSLYWSVERARWVCRLPGVTFMPRRFFQSNDGARTIGFSVDRERFWLYPWVHPDGGSQRHVYIKEWADLFCGYPVYSKQVLEEGVPVEIAMPERTYQGTARRYLARWKRPRWPWPKTLIRVDIDVAEPGIPIPGAGENDWDQDDQAISSTTTNANTIEQGVQNLIASAMRDRKRYGGGEDWRPST